MSSFPFGRLDPRVLDHHPSSSSVFTGTGDGNAAIWNLDTGARRIVFPVVRAVAGAFRPDGARVVTANTKSAIEIWDTATGRRVGSLPRHDGAVFQVCYSPDGARLATGGWDETVRVWDAETGRLLASLAGHRKGIRTLAFSPDGAFIATGSGDRSVKVWDGDTGHQLASFEGHLGDVLHVTYSPDGAYLLSAGGDGNANVWDVHLASAGEIERLVQRPVPWQLAQGRLLAVPMRSVPDARMPAFP
jgi:WD40 repeat protein